MQNFEKLRPVGRLEQYSTTRHNLKFYLGPAVTASYTLPSNSDRPLKDYVYQALRDVIAEHPILSAILVDEQTQAPYFARLPEIQLDKCVTFGERRHKASVTDARRDAELDELLSNQHGVSYELPGPFWRLRVMTATAHDFIGAFFYHHALGDGNSGLAFHRTFHRALSKAVLSFGDATSLSVITSPAAPIFPSLEALHPLPITTWHLIKILFQEKVWSSRQAGLWTGQKCAPLGRTRIRHSAFTSSTTTDFKHLCRENRTTVTAALHTLVAGVIFSHIPATYTSLKLSGALSARRFLPESSGVTEDSMGVWIQDLSDTYDRTAFQADGNHVVLPWSEAQRSRRTIEDTLCLNGTNSAVGLLKYVNNFQQELFLSKVGKDRSSSFEVSNLGLYKPSCKLTAEEKDKVKINRMVFTQSAGVTSAAIQVSIVTGPDGCLVLGFSWQENIVDDSLIENVIRDVEAEIDGLTGVP